ncbi:MAG: hypothetical protein ACE5IY_15050 [bacterium]
MSVEVKNAGNRKGEGLLFPKTKSHVLKTLTLQWAAVLGVLTGAQAFALPQEVSPLLEFPQTELDDPSTYRDYTTRFFRDSAGNTFQIAIYQTSGRVVNIWADAANESISFTVRDTSGKPARLAWGSAGALVSSGSQNRFVQYSLVSEARALDIGFFLLCSMRKEREFQYHQRHKLAYGAGPYIEQELLDLITSIEKLPANVRQRHLSLLGAKDSQELGSRLVPQVSLLEQASKTKVVVAQPTLDGKNHLSLELSVDRNQAVIHAVKDEISIRSIRHQPLQFTIRVGTDSPTLTPLGRHDIFDREFLQYYERAKVEHDALLNASGSAQLRAATREKLLRFERLQRQVRSVELLSFQEKLMAGLPNFATYFGRDMMMSALMMEPIWSPAMLEHVIASVLRKLSANGEVSHEESLGGQAIRENAREYNRFIADFLRQKAQKNDAEVERTLARAEKVLTNLQAARENYLMVDDDFQLPVLVARYLARPDIPNGRKKEFMLAPASDEGKTSRLELLMRNLVYAWSLARRYAEDPVATNLVSFPGRDEARWFAGSWRDSPPGYANGRYALDINVAWVPKALESVETIFAVLHELGIAIESPARAAPNVHERELSELAQNPDKIRRAIAAWRNAGRHFEVHLSSKEVERRVRAKLASLPDEERIYWEKMISTTKIGQQDIDFLAISLDAEGQPIPVANTDYSTWLFLADFTNEILAGNLAPEEVLKWLRIFLIPYPVGLYVEGVGPVAASDTYASSEVRESYRRDPYHSPRTIWGREVNLLLLGLARQIAAAFDSHGRIKNARLEPYVQELQAVLEKTTAAVESSGLEHNELWTYRIADRKLRAARYATSSDIQLWNLTDLAVQYLLEEIVTF